jgi:DNA primase
MFALNFAKKDCSKQAILVEGNMDVIALHQAGFTPAVAALGTSFTEEQARVLARYTKEVVLTMDADSAGEKATDRALGILKNVGVDIKVLRLPECKDPDEFIKKHGNARFQKLLDTAMSAIDYQLLTAARDIDLEATDGKLKYLNKACEVLAALNDPIAVDLYTGRLSAKYGVAKERLLAIVKNSLDSKRRQQSRKELQEVITPTQKKNEVNPQRQQFKKAATAEETVISALVRHPDSLESVKLRLDPSDFLTDFNRRLFERIVSIIETGHNFDLVLLGDEFSPDEIGYVTKMLMVGVADSNHEKVLSDSIEVILAERKAADKPDIAGLDDDAWANAMADIIKAKKK